MKRAQPWLGACRGHLRTEEDTLRPLFLTVTPTPEGTEPPQGPLSSPLLLPLQFSFSFHVSL